MAYTKNPDPKKGMISFRVKEDVKLAFDKIAETQKKTRQEILEPWFLSFVNKALRDMGEELMPQITKNPKELKIGDGKSGDSGSTNVDIL